MLDFIHLALMVLLIISSILAIELDDIVKAIVAFSVMSVFLAMIFYILGAPYVAVFQLLIYAGAVTVLLLAAIHTMRKGGERNEK
ncbi:MAG: NADH-quinone oxidoreductase subunit J [Candidatus Bathyarchaeia archaeon]